MVTRILFSVCVALVALQRVLELKASKANERQMLALGGREHAPGHYLWMKVLHTAWFVSILVEVWAFDADPIPWLSAVAVGVFVLGQWLRYRARRDLGWRWSVRIFTVPGRAPETQGIYATIRHPNYLGVILEIAALPLVHGAAYTALGFTVANAMLLFVRIRLEERALGRTSTYGQSLGRLPRFFPRVSRTPKTS